MERNDSRRVTWAREGAIAVVTLDNAPLNLLTMPMRAELDECLRAVEVAPEIRAVVLTGAGTRSFSAGSDMREFPRQPGAGRQRGQIEQLVYGHLDNLPLPTVAAINGLALGGGLELALCCDLRVVAEDAIVGLPEAKIGVIPGGGGTQRLPRLIGEARAKEMMFLGEPITAREALAIGLANRLAPPGEALAAAVALAQQIASRPAVAVQAIKQSVGYGRGRSLAEGLQREAQLMDDVFLSHDAQEGVAAFLAKRAPAFKHT